MIPHIRAFVGTVATVFPVRGPVVEIGSYQVEGQKEIADMRPFFKGMHYTGCDLRPGPGVDRLEDIQKMGFNDDSIGTLLVLETLEHVQNPFKAFEEMQRVLSPKGLLIISIPFYFPIHTFPSDYWRLTPYCLDMMLAKMHRMISWENALLDYGQAKTKPRTVFALASKQPLPSSSVLEMLRYLKAQSHHYLIGNMGEVR